MTDIIVPRRREDFFDNNGNPTLRFIRFLELLTASNNSTTTVINNAAAFSTAPAAIQQIRKELDGLPEFTMDTTGFTMDSTQWSMDKVIA